MRLPVIATTLLLLGALVFSCKGEDGGDEESDSESESTDSGSDDSGAQDGALAISGDNDLVDAFPSGLSVDSFSSEETDLPDAAAGTLQITYDETALALQTNPSPPGSEPGPGGMSPPPGDDMCVETPPEGDENTDDECSKRDFETEKARRPPSDKNKEINAIISGEGDCISPGTLASLDAVLKFSQSENLDAGSGCFKPDWGILAKNHKDGDVCMVGTVREQIDESNLYVDLATGVVAAMLCQGKKDGIISGEIASGDELNFTETFAKVSEKSSFTINSAIVSRLDDVDGKSVYKTDINMTKNDISFELSLVNSPDSKGSVAGSGVLSIQHDDFMQGGGPENQPLNLTQPGPQCGMDDLKTPAQKSISIAYNKTLEEEDLLRLNLEVRVGLFKQDLEVFDDNGIVDFNTSANFDGQPGSPGYGSYSSSASSTDVASRMKYYVYDGYPEAGVGKMSYWVNFGGSYTEAARGFILDSHRLDGQLVGCGIVGATSMNLKSAQSIRKSLYEGKDLAPVGHTRPFLKVNGECGESGPEVWKQCFVKNDAGKFVLDESKTTDIDKGFDFIPAKDAGIVIPKSENIVNMNLPPPTFRPKPQP